MKIRKNEDSADEKRQPLTTHMLKKVKRIRINIRQEYTLSRLRLGPITLSSPSISTSLQHHLGTEIASYNPFLTAPDPA